MGTAARHPSQIAANGIRVEGRMTRVESPSGRAPSNRIRPAFAKGYGAASPPSLDASAWQRGEGTIGGGDITKQTQFFCKKANEMTSVSKKTNPFQSQSKPIQTHRRGRFYQSGPGLTILGLWNDVAQAYCHQWYRHRDGALTRSRDGLRYIKKVNAPTGKTRSGATSWGSAVTTKFD